MPGDAPRGEANVAVLGARPPGVSAVRLRKLVQGVLALAPGGRGGRVTVRFASDRTVRRYNHRYRGIDRPTDILSFPSGDPVPGSPHMGDLLLSRDRVRLQARRAGIAQSREVDELVVHGVLHLLGYDHESDDGEMNALELRLRARLLDRAGIAT